MNDSSESFKKISHADERSRIIVDLLNSKTLLIGKTPENDDLFQLEPLRLSESKLTCLTKASLPGKFPTPAIMTFGLGGEKYFFNSTISLIRENRYDVDVSGDLFHLQRRESYRIRVPESFAGRYDVIELNGGAVKFSMSVVDLSAGGARMTVDTRKGLLKIGDFMEGTLTLGSKDGLSLKTRVRHHKVIPHKNLQEFGVSFLEISTSQENRLFAITMELHRELLSKF